MSWRKGNIIRTGLVLLVVLALTLSLIGNVMTTIAAKMNDRIVDQWCDIHYDIISGEFERTVDMANFIAEGLAASDSPATLTSAVLRLDRKVSRVDIASGYSAPTEGLHRRGDTLSWRIVRPVPEAPDPTQSPSASTPQTPAQSTSSASIAGAIPTTQSRSTPPTHTSETSHTISPAGRTVTLWVDLDNLFKYMSHLEIRQSSYAVVYSPDGTRVLYPDELLIGTYSENTAEIEAVRRVVATGKHSGGRMESDYLKMPVERRYFPLCMGSEQWVVALSVPLMSLDEELMRFRLYTAIIVIVALGLFSTFLIYSQARWRREYHARQRAEGESAQIQMQRIIEQVNPHFLFNSFNSLYSLINTDRTLAREFVLKLSGVYRYVLDRRKDTLSTLGSEADFTRQYMFLQNIRFGDQVVLDVDIDTALTHHLIPSLSLQTLVENAVKHNTFTPQEPLRIRIFSDAELLVVENDYSPRKPEAANSTGLGLERLQSIYDYLGHAGFRASVEGNVFRTVMPLLPPDRE